MSENKCQFCGEAMITTKDKIVLCENADCATMFNEWDYPKVCAAIGLAKATRTLEDAMEPLNSGRLKMGQALPAIRLAMEDQRACEQRVLEVFK